MRQRFTGQIAGVGSASGVRVVVGHWLESPLGTFTDVMLADRNGRRLLLAPNDDVADFVSATYTFDEVVTGPVTAQVSEQVSEQVAVDAAASSWTVHAPGLELTFSVGPRTVVGHLLRAVPNRLATAPAWTRVTDPVARRMLRGVRTRGTAGGGRREYYGATDLHRILSLSGTWRDLDLGGLAPVSPEPGFGFGSTPERPAVTSIVTTIDLPDDPTVDPTDDPAVEGA